MVWKRVIITFGIVFLVLFMCMWFFFGLKEYVGARIEINKLPKEQRREALANFIGKNDPYLYGGILAGINTKVFPGVWIWGRKGLQYFRTDEHSVYSYFSICDNITNSSQFSVDRSVDTNLIVWKDKVKAGQYIVILVTKQNMGGTVGNLREAKAQDWWGFIPKVNITKQCEK